MRPQTWKSSPATSSSSQSLPDSPDLKGQLWSRRDPRPSAPGCTWPRPPAAFWKVPVLSFRQTVAFFVQRDVVSTGASAPPLPSLVAWTDPIWEL